METEVEDDQRETSETRLCDERNDKDFIRSVRRWSPGNMNSKEDDPCERGVYRQDEVRE